MLHSTTIIVEAVPKGAINWPISQGMDILPRLAPTKNQLVVFPDMCMRLCASFRIVGKMEAINSPVPIVPNHKTHCTAGNKMMSRTLMITPIRSAHRMVWGFKRAANGIETRRPTVNVPQKVALMVAARVGVP